MYLRRELIDEVGDFDEGFPMAYEDVDYCLRAWEAGWDVRYEPSSRLTHLESPTRGPQVGERERRSQRTSGPSGATGSTRATCGPRTAGCGSST